MVGDALTATNAFHQLVGDAQSKDLTDNCGWYCSLLKEFFDSVAGHTRVIAQ
jgi:hypothetical protein